MFGDERAPATAMPAAIVGRQSCHITSVPFGAEGFRHCVLIITNSVGGYRIRRSLPACTQAEVVLGQACRSLYRWFSAGFDEAARPQQEPTSSQQMLALPASGRLHEVRHSSLGRAKLSLHLDHADALAAMGLPADGSNRSEAFLDARRGALADARRAASPPRYGGINPLPAESFQTMAGEDRGPPTPPAPELPPPWQHGGY